MDNWKHRSGAFTLVELLTVIGIVAVLAAVLFPVFSNVRRKARETTTLSNLRQCGVALRMYMSDHDTEIPPDMAIARGILKNAPTCDPSDYWRTSCTWPTSDPMIGSYAYVRGVVGYTTDEGWTAYAAQRVDPTILVSIFSSDNQVRPFTGEGILPRDCKPPSPDCAMPNRVTRLRFDGSVATVPFYTFGGVHENGTGGTTFYFMKWSGIFFFNTPTAPVATP